MKVPDLFQIQDHMRSLFELFYPETCCCCKARLNEKECFICLKCDITIPRTFFDDEPNNSLEKKLWGRIPFQRVWAMFHLTSGGKVQELLYQIKYMNKYELGLFMGERMGKNLKKMNWINEIDMIIPVPLHRRRLLKRGYNQCEALGSGISNMLEIPLRTSVLRRNMYNKSQTNYKKARRWKNVEGIFRLAHPEMIKGKHVLLIDDVVTTGSTLEACTDELMKGEHVKVSIATMACAGGL